MPSELDPVDRLMQHIGRALAVAGVAAGALFLAYMTLGMPGMDHGPAGDPGSMASMDHGSMTYASLPVDEFDARMSQDAFVVNVHRPYEGEIDGTDAFIDFDDIVGDQRLPSDTDSSILLYCASGRMSATAADALVSAGYTHVGHLEGGMEAWEASGMPIRRGS
ncbi:rhodanese-like domain-containing protein [Actinomarinicola tropica]|nr:rhodanese-like domain-containing protein [Actinomarinicola tropica]